MRVARVRLTDPALAWLPPAARREAERLVARALAELLALGLSAEGFVDAAAALADHLHAAALATRKDP